MKRNCISTRGFPQIPDVCVHVYRFICCILIVYTTALYNRNIFYKKWNYPGLDVSRRQKTAAESYVSQSVAANVCTYTADLSHVALLRKRNHITAKKTESFPTAVFLKST